MLLKLVPKYDQLLLVHTLARKIFVARNWVRMRVDSREHVALAKSCSPLPNLRGGKQHRANFLMKFDTGANLMNLWF